MSKRNSVTAFLGGNPAFAVSVSLCLAVTLLAETSAPSRAAPLQGEITRNDVYVRSGSSANHYTVCKLRAGDRVTVVGRQGEWCEILPPPDTFSLISGDYVDTADGQNGVVNGENVRVRAGSTLNDQKYTVQASLSRGAKVRILGKNPDGFLRIEPPPGATLWISQAYLEFVPDGLVRLEAHGDPSPPTVDASQPVSTSLSASPPSTVGDSAETARPQYTETPGQAPNPQSAIRNPQSSVKQARVAPTVQSPDTGGVPSPLSMVPPSPQRQALEQIDAALEAEAAKPAAERNVEPLIERYRALAEQNEDELARRYAEARLGQLGNLADLLTTLGKIRELNEAAGATRRRLMEERTNADYINLPPVPTGFDAQGELRTSALYPPGAFPRRYRLVDPEKPEGRTIGYVELPPDSNIQIDAFLGRYVGIRAVEKRLQTGGVDPVPIFLVKEIALLQPAAQTASAGQS